MLPARYQYFLTQEQIGIIFCINWLDRLKWHHLLHHRACGTVGFFVKSFDILLRWEKKCGYKTKRKNAKRNEIWVAFNWKINIQIFSLLLCIVPVSVFKFPSLVRFIFNSLLKKRSEFRKMLSKRSSLLYRQAAVKWSLKEVCFFQQPGNVTVQVHNTAVRRYHHYGHNKAPPYYIHLIWFHLVWFRFSIFFFIQIHFITK